MRVLHINPGQLYGGVETFLVTLARCRESCPEMVPEFALCVGGRLHDELRQAGSPVHLLGAARASRPWTVLRARAALRRVLTLGPPFDVVVCHQPWTLVLFGGVVRKSGTPCVAYFHGPLGHEWPDFLARWRSPQLVVAPSRHALDTVRGLFPGTTGEALHYPVPAHVAATTELPDERRRTVRAELGARDGDVVVLQASRIERWKGPDLVLRALARLREVPNWQFWLAGGPQREREGAYFTELKQLAAELDIEGRVKFLGQRTDVSVLMRAADLYCQGNRGPEGFSLAFLEAHYCGLPIVTPDLGGAAELIDPSTGILVAPENVEDLAGALRALVTDAARRKAMGTRARDKARELCDATKQLFRLSQMLGRASAHERKSQHRDGRPVGI